MFTWRKLLKTEMKFREDQSEKIICVMSDEEIDTKFFNGSGSINGKSFLAWTDDFVYFKVIHEGEEWVESIQRNPTLDDSEIYV